MMKKDVTLYSAALPLFALLLTPKAWLYLLPLDLLVTALALYLTLNATGRTALYKPMWKKEVWLAWLLGFVADAAGALVLKGLSGIEAKAGSTWEGIAQGIAQNPFASTNSLIMVFIAIIIAGALKYVLDLWLAFRRTEGLSLNERRTVCLALAMFTAPYTFLLPGAWLRFLG